MEATKEDIQRIRKTFCAIHSCVAEFCKKINYNPNTLWLLFALDDGKLKSQKQICEEWHASKTTLNTLVKQCEKQGYIELKPLEGQKREKYLILTPKGKEYTKRGLGAFYKAEQEALNGMQNYKKFIEDMEIFHQKLRTTLNK